MGQARAVTSGSSSPGLAPGLLRLDMCVPWCVVKQVAGRAGAPALRLCHKLPHQTATTGVVLLEQEEGRMVQLAAGGPSCGCC